MPGAPSRRCGKYLPTGGAGSQGTFPLTRSSNSRYLQTAGGSPFLIKEASAAWGIFQAPSLANAKDFIDRRAAEGHNMIKCSAISKDVNMPGSPPNWSGNPPFTTPGDFSTAAGATTYWNHVLDVIRYAATKGIEMGVVPCYLGYPGVGGDQGWADEMNADSDAHCATYGTFLGNLLKNEPNVLWIPGGDQVPGSGSGGSVILSRFTSCIDALLAVDTSHFVAGHYAGDYGGGVTVDDPVVGGMLASDFATYSSVVLGSRGVNMHYGYNPQVEVYTRIRTAYALGIAVFLGDESYGDNLSAPQPQGTPALMRAKTHRGMCEGACGWSFGYGTDWYTWTNWSSSSQALAENGFAMTFWALRPWHLMAPDVSDTFATAGRGTYGTTDYVNVRASSTAFVAWSNGANGNLTVDMTQFSRAMRVERWDPTSGTYVLINANLANTGTFTWTHPGNNSQGDPDQILVMS